MTISDIRARFPYLDTGRIYLNHAATSPASRTVEQGMLAYLDRWTRGEIDFHHDVIRVLSETRSMAAEMLSVDPGRIAFVQNTSEGLNVLASGLDWKTGDRIVIPDREFPTNVYPFLNLTRRGVEIDFVPQRHGVVEIDAIERAMTPRTKLVAVSWVQFLSGYCIDLDVLSQMCHARGVLLSVDAIQGIGAIRIDLGRTHIDFLAAGVQKWQMGPQGLAIMCMPEHMQERIAQSHLGWLSVRDAWNFFAYDVDLQSDARRYENGTYNSIGMFGYHGALKLFLEVGFEEVERRVRANADHAWNRAHDAGFELLTTSIPDRRAGIVTFRHDRSEEIAATLARKGITVSARSGHIRISPHFYNTTDEIDTAMDAIIACA